MLIFKSQIKSIKVKVRKLYTKGDMRLRLLNVSYYKKGHIKNLHFSFKYYKTDVIVNDVLNE